ncbi:MAG TPA: HNH endonuclease [Verrucomicrobiae bacterium]|nr:HNH endonuclease [Verrucomicrobiae bacterium]
MKIERSKYAETYQCGQKVYAGKMRITDAKHNLAKIGINPNSSVDLVYGLRHMLDGHRYTRTMSAQLVEDYLVWIERDYGRKFLKNAVSALKQHVEYYQSLTKSPMRGHVKILEQYAGLFIEEFDEFVSPEEISPSQDLIEGGSKTISVNVYERNSKARRECIEHYGCACSVCGFDFEKKYGAIGKNFIHVHHLRDLASIGKSYSVKPKDDLRPVCPNCHAMLHKSKPAYEINELKRLLAAQ